MVKRTQILVNFEGKTYGFPDGLVVECVPVCAYVCGVCECGGVCCQEVIVMVKSRGRYLLPRLLATTGW